MSLKFYPRQLIVLNRELVLSMLIERTRKKIYIYIAFIQVLLSYSCDLLKYVSYTKDREQEGPMLMLTKTPLKVCSVN